MKSDHLIKPAWYLTAVFIVLKLIGQISWSWWWVLIPLWAPLCAVNFLLALGSVFDLILDKLDV